MRLFPLLILAPNFDDRGRCNNGGGLKLGMALNEGVSTYFVEGDRNYLRPLLARGLLLKRI